MITSNLRERSGAILTLCCFVFVACISGAASSSANAEPTFTTYSSLTSYEAAVASHPDQRLVTFDDGRVSEGSFLSNQYADQFVTFQLPGGEDHWNDLISQDIAASFPTSDPYALRFGTSPFDTLGVTLLFAYPRQAFGGMFIDNGADLRVSVRDPGGTELYLGTVPAGAEEGYSGKFWGVVSDQSVIGEIVVTKTINMDTVGLDDVRYSGQPVPLPGAFLLGGVGLGLVGLGRRVMARRRRKA